MSSGPAAPAASLANKAMQLRRGPSGPGRWKLVLNRVNESNYHYFAGFIPNALTRMIHDQNDTGSKDSFKSFMKVVRQAVQNRPSEIVTEVDEQEGANYEASPRLPSLDSPILPTNRVPSSDATRPFQRASSLKAPSMPRADGAESKNQALLAEQKQAVVLLVDISGFTRLSDKFQGLGQEGIDSLTSTINRMFSTIIEHVEAWNGDVIKFAGNVFVKELGQASSQKLVCVHSHIQTCSCMGWNAFFSTLQTACQYINAWRAHVFSRIRLYIRKRISGLVFFLPSSIPWELSVACAFLFQVCVSCM
jgi:hypothetical protein